MQTQSSSTQSATKQKRKRFPWVIGVLVSIVLIAILAFVAVTLLVLRSQGVTQGIQGDLKVPKEGKASHSLLE